MPELESTMQWKVDITQFTAAMKEVKKSLQATNNEFKLTTSTMDKWSNNTTGIEAKIKQLNGTLDAQKRILEIYKQALSDATKENNAEGIERYNKAINDQQIKINKTQVELGKYNTKLNEMQKEQKESETASSKLNSEIEKQETALSSLKNEYKNAVLQYGENSKEANRLAKEIKNLSGELNENKNKMAELDKAADDLEKELDESGNSANQAANGGFTVLKGALANLVSQGINAAVNGLKTLAREVYNAGSSFESSMSKVQAISGASADDMDKLSAKAKQMGETTIFSAAQSAEAFSYMAMAGWKTEDMLNGIEGVMNLAASSGEDLATSASIVTDALTAMGYEAKDAGKLADVMASAASNANTTIGLMGNTFQYAAPLVGALGYTMEDTAIAIGLMANASIKGEKAGTALRSIFTRLSAPPKDCAEALDAMNISLTDSTGKMRPFREVIQDLRTSFSNLSETQQTANAKAIAGQEAMAGLLAIVNASPEDFEKLTKAIDESGGAANRMSDTMLDNVSGAITILKSKIEGIMIKVFEKASNSIRKSIRTISKALDQVDWDKFSREAGEAAKAVANLFAFIIKNAPTIINTLKTLATMFITYKVVNTVTSVIGVFKTLITTVKGGTSIITAFNTALGLNPYALVAAGIAALGLAIYELYKKQKEATEAQWGLNEAQKANIETANMLKESSEDTAKAMQESTESVLAEYNRIDDLKNKYNELIDANGEVKEGYEDRAEYILNELANALGVERNKIDQIIDANGKLSDSYDQLVLKRKAQAMLDATESDYLQAVKDQTKAVKARVESYNDLIDAQAKYDEAVKNGGSVYDTYNQLVKSGMGEQAYMFYLQNKSVIDAVETTKSALDETKLGYEEASQAWTNSSNTIMLYNDLVEASTSGNVSKINESMLKMQYGFITAENGNRDSLVRQADNFKSMYNDMKNAADAGIEGVTQEQLNGLATLVTLSENELAKLPPEAKKEGENSVSDMASGITSKSGEVKTAMEGVADKAVEGAESENGTNGGSYKSGSNFGEGFFNGIGSWLSSVWNRGWELAANALRGLRSGQQEGSPSKLTRKSGVFFGEGYEGGILDMIKPVTDAASKMATSAVDALGVNMNDQMRVIGENGGNSLINGLNSVMPNVSGAVGDLKTSVAGANAGMVGNASAVGTASSDGSQITTLNFYQTNNSPKALNRWDLYRQTQNILQLAKG